MYFKTDEHLVYISLDLLNIGHSDVKVSLM